LVALVRILNFTSSFDLRSYSRLRLELFSLVLISVASDRVSLLNRRELFRAKVSGFESIIFVSFCCYTSGRVRGLETSVVIRLRAELVWI